MDSKALSTTTQDVIVPSKAGKDQRHRLSKYTGWLCSQDRRWYAPDFKAYRDYLLEDLAPSSVASHLSTVRMRYEDLLADRERRSELWSLAGEKLRDLEQEDSPANRKAFVDETVALIESEMRPRAAPVKVPASQDTPDAAQLRLTPAQARTLVSSPGFDTLRGLRDSAAIGLLLCTGIREFELSALEVRDLRQHMGGSLSLHVREGKGCKQRLVPYGAFDWVLAIVDVWLAKADVEEGPVLRGFWRGNKSLRPGPLSVRGIQYLLKRYPIVVNGSLVTAKPHDLRRTYARLLYDAGMRPAQIQQNLGHADLGTTMGYIGTLDALQREPPAVFTVDVSELYRQVELE